MAEGGGEAGAGLVFRVYAGSPQLLIRDFATLRRVVDRARGVPEALWVATSAPIDGLSCDPAFLRAMDSDRNGRVRAEELREMVGWIAARLRRFEGVDRRRDWLDLEDLGEDQGLLREAALTILESLSAPPGPGGRRTLTLAQIRASDAELRKDHVNGDGIIAPESLAAEPGLRAFVEDLLACMPPEVNRAGQAGAGAALIRGFAARCEAARAHLGARAGSWAWGSASEEIAARWIELEPPLERFFGLCRLVAAQPQVASALRLGGEAAAAAFLRPTGAEGGIGGVLALLPAAEVAADGVLRWDRLSAGPHREGLLMLRAMLAEASGGPGAGVSVEAAGLTEGVWREALAAARRVRAWREREAAEPACRLARLADHTEAVAAALVARSGADAAQRAKLERIADLERLVLGQRWILRFANNFISMPELYEYHRQALFERGRLIVAGREFRLSVAVPDRAAHAKLAEQSSMCIAYVRVEAGAGPDGAPLRPPFEVAVPITAGTSEGIVAGRRGLFYAIQAAPGQAGGASADAELDADLGAPEAAWQEYDAVITQVILQPVSLWEAMTQPFGKIVTFVKDRAVEISGTGDKQVEAGLAAAQAKVGDPASPGSGISGVVAAGGVALAAISSSVAYVLSELEQMTLIGLLQSVAALALLVMVPSGIGAWLKLRQRNLAILLEGSGWALNDRLLLTRELGQMFTRRPARPEGAAVEDGDQVRDVFGALRARDRRDLDESRESTLLLIVLGLLLFLAISSYGERVAGWLAGWRTPAEVAAPAEPVAPEVAPATPATPPATSATPAPPAAQ